MQPKTLHPNYRFFDDDRHFYSLRKLAQAEGRALEDYLVPYEVPCGAGTFRFGVDEDLHARQRQNGTRGEGGVAQAEQPAAFVIIGGEFGAQ